MSIRPTIFKNALAGTSGGIKNSIKGTSDNKSEESSISRLSEEAKNVFGFSRSSAFDASLLESLKIAGAGQDPRSFATGGSSTSSAAWSLNAGTVGVNGLEYGKSSLVSASTANNLGATTTSAAAINNLGALPGSATPDIFDNHGFGPGQRNFNEIWGNNNGLGHGSSGGGYDSYGNFIANVVKPQMHDKPADAVVDDKAWSAASTNLGFLFKNGDQLNTALEHSLGKLEGEYKDLGKDPWSLSFIAGNGIAKEAINGKVGDFLLSDKKYLDGIQSEQVGIMGNALEAFTHKANEARMAELLSGGKENLSLEEVSHILKERAGIDGDNKFFAGSARGFIETAKNFEFLDNFDSKIKEAISQNPELSGEKAKFNININFLPYSAADSGAFPDLIRGHQFGQQSKLKDFGLSFDPEKPNQLNFMINNEAQLEKLLTDIQGKFAGNENATIGKLDFSFHRHGGEDGSNLTGNAQAKDQNNTTGGSFAVNDANSFDGKTDGDIYKLLGKIAGENGADININGDSCHSGNHTDLIKDDLVAGVKEGQTEAGRDEMLKLSVVDNGANAGYTPAQSLKSIQGYMTYKFDNDGAAGLEFVMSNSSLSTTRRDDMYVNKDTDVSNLDSARADKSQLGQTAMNEYVDQTQKNIDALAERKAGDEDSLTSNDNQPEAKPEAAPEAQAQTTPEPKPEEKPAA